MTGIVTSSVQVAVRVTVTATLLQPSVAFQVLVCERVHVVGEETVLVITVGKIVLQASVTVAVPKAASICATVGLQPKANGEPVALIIGRVISSVLDIVCSIVLVLLQASVAVQVRL